jgi:hypothetical protein
VAEGESPEFKLQYQKKKKKRLRGMVRSGEALEGWERDEIGLPL